MIKRAEIQKDFSYIGWNSVEIRMGSSLFDLRQTNIVKKLDFHVGGIRNCSYSPVMQYIGISAEDMTNGGQVLAIYGLSNEKTNIIFRQEYVLYHALNQMGTKVCYTLPSKETQGKTADLFLFHFGEKRSNLLVEGLIGLDCTPAWFPNDTHIAYHTPEKSIEIFNIAEGKRDAVEIGQAPSVSPDGAQIAFRRGNDILISSFPKGRTHRIEMKSRLFNRNLTNGLSWSPDGAYLSFGRVGGIVGKETDFYLFEIVSGAHKKTRIPYLSSLFLLNEHV